MQPKRRIFILLFERCVRVLTEGMNLHLETYTQDTAKQDFIMAVMEWGVKAATNIQKTTIFNISILKIVLIFYKAL